MATYDDPEMAAVAAMIQEAEKYGLLVEVILSFAQSVASGGSVEHAAACALYEWDI